MLKQKQLHPSPATNIKVAVPEAKTTLLGKTADELQENIEISKDRKITGDLLYVTNYKEFSSNVDEQNGNYLALSFPEATQGQEITCEVKGDGSIVKKPVKVDSKDGFIVLKIANTSQIIEVVKGEESITLDLTQLQLKSLPGA